MEVNNELLVWTYDGRNVLDHEGGRIDAGDPSYINFDIYVPDGKMIHLIIQYGVRVIPDSRFRHFCTLIVPGTLNCFAVLQRVEVYRF